MTATQQTEYAFIVRLTVKPGREAELRALLCPVLDAMRHETSFVNAILHRDDQEADRFMIYETWSDLQDLTEVQMHRPYRQAFWAALPDLLAQERQIETWRPMRRDLASA